MKTILKNDIKKAAESGYDVKDEIYLNIFANCDHCAETLIVLEN